MEVKIENIIEKLKKEGVEGAQKVADEVLSKARKQASQLINNAERDAKKIVEDAQMKAASFEENSKVTIEQAVRDSELLLKSRIEALFDRVFKKQMADVLEPEFIKMLIIKLTEQWGKDAEAELTISKADQATLEKLLFSGVKKELKAGITLKASSDLSHGFRIGLKGDDVYYDFSDEGIAEILKMRLNPRIKEILDIKHG